MDSTFNKLTSSSGCSGLLLIDKEGNMIESSGDLLDSNPSSEQSQTLTIFKLMQNVNQLLHKSAAHLSGKEEVLNDVTGIDPLKKVTVCFSDTELSFAVHHEKIYGIKKTVN
ncbi:hypothetical protein DSO57_1021612 [Entomophthora muscae]|uniref:Uncharacterized protein n=1 Tax=Entomophthora muscae TaxID=34485 RepID=A0ACC2UNH3_9FUNG|nr:hypothetical protein DSO57_1021612 [Entomophthora muscae]